VYALDANSGTQIWKKAVGPNQPQNITSLGGNGSPQSSPNIVGNKLYVGSVDSKVYCLDIANQGNILWSFETVKGEKKTGITCCYATPAIDGDYVYVVGSNTGPALGMFGVNANITIYKLDRNTGTPVLTINYPFGPVSSPVTNTVFGSPVVADGKIILSDQCTKWY
jgi:outer membrane protein assembly factor BamB